MVQRGGPVCAGVAKLEFELAPIVREGQEHRVAGSAALFGRGWRGLLSLLLLICVFAAGSGGSAGSGVQGGEVLDELDSWRKQRVCVERRLLVMAAAHLPPASVVAPVKDDAVDEQQRRLENRRKEVLDRVQQPAETADHFGC